MTIEESKEKLKKEGYNWFELNEFDPEFYNWLLPLKCTEESNIKDKFVSLIANSANKFTNEKPQYRETFETHTDASQKVKQILDLVNTGEIDTSQMWYYADFNTVVTNPIEITKFENYIKNMMMYFFDFDEIQEYSLFSPTFTYYEKGCHLQNHSDGTGTGRICALLIYLNETYDENDGGILVLNNTENVIPTFGKVAIIDLQTFDIKHMVTEVTSGIGRYALLSFIKRKEDEFIHSDADRKKV